MFLLDQFKPRTVSHKKPNIVSEAKWENTDLPFS